MQLQAARQDGQAVVTYSGEPGCRKRQPQAGEQGWPDAGQQQLQLEVGWGERHAGDGTRPTSFRTF